MASVINAKSTAGGGLVITGDATGQLVLQTNNGVTALTLDTAQNIITVGQVGVGSTPDGSAWLQIGAGTTSVAPLELISGPLMTTPDGGSVEYDGNVFYTTPVNNRRGISPSEYYYRLNSGFVGSNSTSPQPMFGVGITLDANTQYEFEILFLAAKTTGTGSHTMSTIFGGTATISNIAYQVFSVFTTSAFPIATATAQTEATLTNAALVVKGSSSVATQSVAFLLKGTVAISAGGTFIPHYVLSVLPGGSYTTQAGSYVMIKPIGAGGANINVGGWA